MQPLARHGVHTNITELILSRFGGDSEGPVAHSLFLPRQPSEQSFTGDTLSSGLETDLARYRRVLALQPRTTQARRQNRAAKPGTLIKNRATGVHSQGWGSKSCLPCSERLFRVKPSVAGAQKQPRAGTDALSGDQRHSEGRPAHIHGDITMM